MVFEIIESLESETNTNLSIMKDKMLTHPKEKRFSEVSQDPVEEFLLLFSINSRYFS